MINEVRMKPKREKINQIIKFEYTESNITEFYFVYDMISVKLKKAEQQN